jgi:transcriptional regulator with XRE-family HTH domain
MLIFDGAKLRQLRTKRELTQGQLAALVGKKTADISNYENGIANPTSDTLLNLQTFFKVSAKEISRKAEEANA